MADDIRWGIIGTGNIARKFAEDLLLVPDAKLVAIASRSKDGAEKFGADFNIEYRHESYAALVGNRLIDCVYIATPHPFHFDNALLCLNAGKAVLCEKPFTLNATQAKKLVDVAREKDVLLMEAMWTRFFPAIQRVRQLVGEGTIGEVQFLTADFGFSSTFDPNSRLYSPDLGGGALLDVGIYPISFASMLLGRPIHVTGTAVLGKSGVDEQTAMILTHKSGALAVLHTTVRANTSWEANIIGTRGRIIVHSPFWKAHKITLLVDGRDAETFDAPYTGQGYHFEAVEFMNRFRAGETESPLMPLDESISIMETLDSLRRQFGIKYPME